MKPIVLVGGGEIHYRIIQGMKEEHIKNRPVILVAKNIKVLPTQFLPYLLQQNLNPGQAHLDLWTACQRKGVYFLEDECLKINREDKTLNLKKFGRLAYHKLSVESPSGPTCLGHDLSSNPSHILPTNGMSFMQSVRAFVAEVQKHCPREVRVLFSGFNLFSLQMATILQEKLKGGCEASDILILDSEEEKEGGLFKSKKQKEIEKLKKLGIRVITGAVVQSLQDHLIVLNDGSSISYDVIIPVSHYRALDVLGKILQFDAKSIMVGRDLCEVRGHDLFVTGNNVHFEREKSGVSEIDPAEVAQTLLQNIFLAEEDAPLYKCRDRKNMETIGWNGNWVGKTKKILGQLREMELLEPSRQTMQSDLNYQAEHMSRPWQGYMNSNSQVNQGQFRLNSVNGFNSWGSFALSAIKITEMALLKSMAKGISPKQIRFSLTLPVEEKHLLNHIFESTFRAIEGVAERHEIEIDGGDTFDGHHWHLNVTVGGEVKLENQIQFNPHDYLIMTRPLGFGFLWAGRQSENFDSQWIQKAISEPMVPRNQDFFAFIEKWNPSGRVLIEEWGFLYHCLQHLPAHQQVTVNFREVPRWAGTDELIAKKVEHPGLNVNWERLSDDVAFKREEVSRNNSVLWDSFSQGSLVFGVKAEKWKEALHDLKEMGYKQAALVGCIRPKSKGNRVVLSDWSPV